MRRNFHMSGVYLEQKHLRVRVNVRVKQFIL